MKIKIVNTKQELDDAYKVRFTVFVDEQNVPTELEIDEYEDIATHVILYDNDGNPIGTGRCREVEEYMKMERICIMKSARGTGAGKMVMLKLEEIGIEKGKNKFKLDAQTHAEGFYKKLGYHTVSGEFMDAGIPHVRMIKEVK